MAKKKNSADQSKGLAKAAKKAKAVAKVEKKEKKKSKGRAVEEDGEDLEDILEQVSTPLLQVRKYSNGILVDAEGMGGVSCCLRRISCGAS